MRIITRTLYLEKIKPFISKPVIKIITGMRRVGKSELLLQLKQHLEADNIKTLYINKEQRKFDFIKNNEDLNKYIDEKGGGKGTALFIDEVQEIHDWEKSVASYLSESIDVYITGSNAHLLSSDLATLLTGRYVEFPIYTLSFSEFNDLINNSKSKEENFQLYLKYGGLPGLHSFDFEEVPSFQYIEAIYQSVLLKDVVKRNNIRNVSLLENITKFLFDNIGNLFNANSVSKYLKSQQHKNSMPTVQAQVKNLCDAYIFHQVKQFDLKGKRYLEINDKYFAADLGMRHAVLGYKESDISGILENIVYLELLRNDYKVSVGKSGKYEIDFVCEKAGQRIYIQVCYLMPEEQIREREFSVLEKVLDNHPKYVISMDPLTIQRESGIKHINLFDFLFDGL